MASPLLRQKIDFQESNSVTGFKELEVEEAEHANEMSESLLECTD